MIDSMNRSFFYLLQKLEYGFCADGLIPECDGIDKHTDGIKILCVSAAYGHADHNILISAEFGKQNIKCRHIEHIRRNVLLFAKSKNFVVQINIHRVINCTAVKSLLLSSFEIRVDFKNGQLVAVYGKPVFFAFGMVLVFYRKPFVLNRSIIKFSAHIQLVQFFKEHRHRTAIRYDMMHIHHNGVFKYSYSQERYFG